VPAIVDTRSDHSREGTETLPYDNGLAINPSFPLKGEGWCKVGVMCCDGMW